MIKEEIFKILDNLTIKFFPETGWWGASCFDRPIEIEERYFPCHTRDNNWLSFMFQKKFKLYILTDNFIKEYIEQSEVFNRERHDYEQRIVKWQIDYMLHDGENWIVDSKLGGDLYLLNSKCDIAFRKGVVDTLSAIGMDSEVIEEGIERNVDIWRPRHINLAFSNVYNPISWGGTIFSKRVEVDPEFKENWIKMRLYEYYQAHKSSVDKYGEVLPQMKMSNEEVEELRKYLDIKGKERLEQIEGNVCAEVLNEKKEIQKIMKKYLSLGKNKT